ncbi:unnamed protein product [Gongylonema pulchrum]|uniref:Uncharacterized protein n=1 Tax=Gongylonema pulchrum TaxID=637853 RepID=A0A183D235_9BILA|nr:unnamed protein product [Gongylonema pulchrum]
MVKDRMSHERYMQFMEEAGNRPACNNNEEPAEQQNRGDWEKWMREQPISVLRLDRTERLVLRIGGTMFFNAIFIKARAIVIFVATKKREKGKAKSLGMMEIRVLGAAEFS